MNYNTILFDLGSTLINYENSNWDELGRLGCTSACPVLKDLANLEVAPEILWEEFHYAIDQMFINHTEDLVEIDLILVTNGILSKLGVTTVDGIAGKFIDAYYQPITRQVTLIPGADEILLKLKNAGMKIGLISNTIFPAEFHKNELKRFDLYDYFDFMIFSSEYKFRKPKKEIYLKAIELAGTKPESCIFVGDRMVEDVGGPQSVGIKGILKHTEGRDYSAPVTPFSTIKDLCELETIILG